ncbi:MAG: hypothetical protein MJE77_26230 [Proteobacteria bacterium]|nr:hypothetical protein [Pseudomonadota bacterium]
MPTLSVAEMIALWERAAREHPLIRALHLLDASQPDHDSARALDLTELARLDVGERNRRLMESLSDSFGDRLQCESTCPQCDEPVEFALDLGQILAQSAGQNRFFQTAIDSISVRFRLPTTLDLIAVASCGDVAAGRSLLFERCIVAAERDGNAVDTSALPATALQHIAGQMNACDPHAETRIRLVCPECGETWRALLDIAELLWAKIADRARATVRAVHLLARAYSWSEADILAMSDRRRALYLSMVDV